MNKIYVSSFIPFVRTVFKLKISYKYGNKFDLLPYLYYLCKIIETETTMTGINHIMSYADNHHSMTVNDIVVACDMKPVTVRQHLSRLAASGYIVRVGYGKYAKTLHKEIFPIKVSGNVRTVYDELCSALPFANFCVYSGEIYVPLQHHLSVNHAVYIETNRDTVESVFSLLKEQYHKVYRQPDAIFMNDYVDLRKDCFIVKPLVTESPIQTIDGVPSPTLEKLLVDILKDPDMEYLRGMEFNYMIETALNQYQLSTTKLLRYAGRRNVRQTVQKIIDNNITERP